MSGRRETEESPSAISGEPITAVTIDLHDGDHPADIDYCAELLAELGVHATFFVPSAMLEMRRYAGPLRELPGLGHEVGSHTHHHDGAEIDALVRGGRSRLGFLELSKRIFEDTYGRAPASFRSPAWCALGPDALDELVRLGYGVDSSATPQRLSVLSSTPFSDTWALSPRRPHFLRPGLLEIPTSSFLVPAGSPTFLIFRRVLSLAFVRALMAEASISGRRVLVLQLHAEDFNPDSERSTSPVPLSAGDFFLRRQGGFGFKHHLKERNRARISATTRAVLRLAARNRCLSLSGAAEALLGPARAGAIPPALAPAAPAGPPSRWR